MTGDDKTDPSKAGPTATPDAPHAAAMVYTTFPSEAAAATFAEALVTAGLVACANIVPGLTSIYVWEGKLEREREVAVILKTRAAIAPAVVAETRRLHPYANPAIVVLPIIAGSPDYLAWISQQTAGTLPRDT